MNNTFVLRTVSIPGIGTFGRFISPEGDEICKSVEREWLNNMPSVSCFPEGLYELVKTESPKYGARYHIVNPDLGVSVAGNTPRTHILIHGANYPKQLQGCIAPGTSYMKTSWGVASSRYALTQLEEELDKIAECPGAVFLKVIRSHM